jgi:hypothetical protein
MVSAVWSNSEVIKTAANRFHQPTQPPNTADSLPTNSSGAEENESILECDVSDQLEIDSSKGNSFTSFS